VKSIGPEALEPMVVRNNNCDLHVKLFVGRFPINLDDCAIVKLFENYCEVIDFIRLQPKVKDMQTGCGLLKVASVEGAVEAIRAINGQFVFKGFKHVGTVQVQFAFGEAERLNLSEETFGTCVKLFVGGVPRGFPESELREVFSKFGSVGEIFTISNNRNSLGKYVSCFVRMNRTADARRAIEGLNGKTALKDSSKLLEVKFADSCDKALTSNTNTTTTAGSSPGPRDRSFLRRSSTMSISTTTGTTLYPYYSVTPISMVSPMSNTTVSFNGLDCIYTPVHLIAPMSNTTVSFNPTSPVLHLPVPTSPCWKSIDTNERYLD